MEPSQFPPFSPLTWIIYDAILVTLFMLLFRSVEKMLSVGHSGVMIIC